MVKAVGLFRPKSWSWNLLGLEDTIMSLNISWLPFLTRVHLLNMWVPPPLPLLLILEHAPVMLVLAHFPTEFPIAGFLSLWIPTWLGFPSFPTFQSVRCPPSQTPEGNLSLSPNLLPPSYVSGVGWPETSRTAEDDLELDPHAPPLRYQGFSHVLLWHALVSSEGQWGSRSGHQLLTLVSHNWIIFSDVNKAPITRKTISLLFVI